MPTDPAEKAMQQVAKRIGDDLRAADNARRDAAEKEAKMAEEKEAKEKADAVKADADAGEKIDKILACLDSILADSAKLHSRLDSIEKTRADGAEAALIDKHKKKDVEEEVEEKGRPLELKADFKLDSDGRAIRYNRTEEEANANALAEVQSRADQACSSWGNAVERPFTDEPVDSYRRRTARRHQQYSPKWKDVDLKTLSGKGLAVASDIIFADSVAASSSNDTFEGFNDLRMVRKFNPDTGHVSREFFGSPKSWMQQFSMRPYRARIDKDLIKRRTRND